MTNLRPYHPTWGTFGCSVAWLKALITTQFVLAFPCIVSQILFFVYFDYEWQCIVYPASVSSVLFLISACIGIAALAKREKTLIATYLLIGSAALMAAVILGLLSWTSTYRQFWSQLKEPFSADSLLIWVLLIVSCLEIILFMFSSLTAGIALSRFDPAFKNKLLGFGTEKLRKGSSAQSVDTVKEEVWVKTTEQI